MPLSVWILQNLWAVILLALVIIFQQEIREVLGRITLPTFLVGKPEVLPLKGLDKIAEAAFSMASKGIGGLIVLQQGDDLDEFIHGKTLLDWQISKEFIMTIFNPQSPLHDGTIAIRGDRLRYATALLPVSTSVSLPNEWELGTVLDWGLLRYPMQNVLSFPKKETRFYWLTEGKLKRKNARKT